MIRFLKLTTIFQPGEYGKPNHSSKYFMDYTFYGVRYFPKGEFPSGNFSKVRLGLLRHRRLQWGPSAALGWARDGSRALQLGETWEVATWENTLGKLPLGKKPLGKYRVSHETWQFVNSFECLHLYTVYTLKTFCSIIRLKKSFTKIYFILISILPWYDCHIIFFMIHFGIKQQKTFLTIHRLSCFVGHPVPYMILFI